MKYLSFFLVLFLISGLNEANCQYRMEWKLFYSPYPNYSSYCKDLVTDTYGNIYAIYTLVTNTAGNSYCETVKYSPAGDSIWHRKFILPSSNTSGADIAIDPQNNVYISGYQHALKYDENGNLLWTYNGPYSYANICIDAKKNVYLNGYGQNTITAKLDSNGNLLWSHNYLYGDYAEFTVDKNKNVYTAGTNYSNNNDYFLIHYNSVGDSTWVRRYNGPSSNSGEKLSAVTVDTSCNAYVTGASGGNLNVIKYDSLGNLIWERRYGGGNITGMGYDIKVDKDQNIIVYGITGSSQFVTLKYSPSGDQIWEFLYTGYHATTTFAKKIFVDNITGEIYVLLKSALTTGYKVLCISGNGVLNWAAEDNVANGYPYRVIKDRFNNVFVTGFQYGNVDKILIEKYSPISTSVHQTNYTPESYSLDQNYPNPFNPSTQINYKLPNTNFVILKVYDVLGNEVETLVNEKQNAGTYSVSFNAASRPSGMYFYKLVTGGFSETKKMILIK